jgi:HAD superfamily hydrolase (TIGR01450 family)
MTSAEGDSAAEDLISLAENFDAILFDLDGVLYRGLDGIPGAAEVVQQLSHHGIRRSFVTNNASRTATEIANQLRSLGIDAKEHEVVTSAHAAAYLCADMLPEGSPIFVVGGSGIEHALRDVGFEPRRDPSTCVAVVQGYGPDISWRDLAEASYLIEGGATWIATNLDSTFPTERGIAPGNGSLVQAVANAVGRPPDAVGGKPAQALLTIAIKQSNSENPLMVGDRYDTDILAGVNLGIPTLLVLSGVCTVGNVWQSHVRATFLGESVSALSLPYPRGEVMGDVARFRDSIAHFDQENQVVTSKGGQFIDQLRAADALKWELSLSLGTDPFASGQIQLQLVN